MKNVMVITVLFLFTASLSFSQDIAAISDAPLSTYEMESDHDDKTKFPKKTDSPIFITGSDFQSELTGLRLMPTPAKEKVELLIQSNAEKVYTVELFDQLGNVLRKYEVTSNDPRAIMVDQYKAGSYYFLIYIPDGSIKKKFQIVD